MTTPTGLPECTLKNVIKEGNFRSALAITMICILQRKALTLTLDYFYLLSRLQVLVLADTVFFKHVKAAFRVH